jgi:hypothetical protein
MWDIIAKLFSLHDLPQSFTFNNALCQRDCQPQFPNPARLQVMQRRLGYYSLPGSDGYG